MAEEEGLGAADVVRMGDPAHVPELGEHDAPLGVDRVCYLLPACHLLGAVDARRPGAALAGGIYLGAFADDEAGPGTLGVVGRHHGVGHVPGWLAGAGHGGMTMRLARCSWPRRRGRTGIVVHDGFLNLWE